MSNPISVVGRRIRLAREQKRMSQAELAHALGRTPTAISYWEGGQRSPGLEDIVRVAEILGVDPAALLPSQPPRVLARAQASQLAVHELADVVDLVVARYEHSELPKFVRPAGKTGPADMAANVNRSAEQENPPIDLGAVMARYGVTYLEEDLPPALSGFVVFVNESPLVVVNKDDSEVRRRFSSAHELGHVLLAHHDTFYVDLSRSDGVPPDYNWRYEREANDFASALLIPADLVRRELHAAINPTARLLAERFRVSAQAMSIRLSALGLVLEASGEVEIPF